MSTPTHEFTINRNGPDECAGRVYCPDPFLFSTGEDIHIGPSCERCAELDARWDVAWGDADATFAFRASA